jgi:hypothetical protein
LNRKNKLVNDRVVSTAAVEAVDYEAEKPEWADEIGTSTGPGSRERSKRKVKANTLYPKKDFWHH